MANLRVNLAGLELKNPFIIASSPLTAKIDRIKKAEEGGAAAVSIKHTMLKQQFIARPRWYVEKNEGIISSGDPRLEVETCQELVRRAKAETDLKIFTNMSGSSTDVESWGLLAQKLEEAGADAIELNFNCPNLHTAASRGAALGANLGQDPSSCAQVISIVKKSVKIPVVAKLITEGGNILKVAAAAKEANVDILNIHAGFRAAPGLDIYNDGAFLYPGSSAGNFGGFTGPWSRLLSYRTVADIAKTVPNPIIGGGGIFKWEHVVESIMYGSTAVQICTAVMFNGVDIINTMLKGLCEFMDKQGYANIESFRGKALKNVLPPHSMQYQDIAANIDTQKCIGCRNCEKLPTCEAINYSAEDKKCYVNQENCVGCGLCIGICPVKAIKVVLV